MITSEGNQSFSEGSCLGEEKTDEKRRRGRLEQMRGITGFGKVGEKE